VKNKTWEDDHQVRKRALKFGEQLVEEMPQLFSGKNTKKKVFIVSHQAFLKCFLAESLTPSKRMPPGSSCINSIHFDRA
jgi:broad specificity phosphatase PhoE